MFVVPPADSPRVRPARWRRFAVLAVLAATCLTVELADPGGVATAATSASQPQTQQSAPKSQHARPRVLLGAVGSVGGLARDIHHPLARHFYRDFSQDVPPGRMLTANSSTRWAVVARMHPGTRIYADVARWGRTLARRHRMTLFAYSHEPEIASKRFLGSANQFKRAYRKVVRVMRAHGATNVRYTWQMTGWAFRVDRSSRMRAGKWYPGDRWVDVIGPDEYNWFTCGEGVGRWVSLGQMARPALRFAAVHHKKLAIPEFASFRNDRRARWVRAAHSFLANNRARVLAVFYFQHPPTNPANRDCRWKLTRRSEYRAFARMAHREGLFRQ